MHVISVHLILNYVRTFVCLIISTTSYFFGTAYRVNMICIVNYLSTIGQNVLLRLTLDENIKTLLIGVIEGKTNKLFIILRFCLNGLSKKTKMVQKGNEKKIRDTHKHIII